MTIIRCDLPPDNYLVWRYPDKSPIFGSQLIVSQTQEAIILASGELAAGAHFLFNDNMTILAKYNMGNLVPYIALNISIGYRF